MILSLDADIQARPSFGDVIRSSRSFTPEGFSEKVWIIFEGNKVGEELFDEVCEQVFEEVFEKAKDSIDSPIARFEKAMRKLNKKIDTSVRLPENFLFENSFAILLSTDNEIHFTTLGNSEVYFIRAGKVMHVSDGISAQTTSDELFLNVASGELQDGDVMIFSTVKLLKYLTHAQMQEIATNDSHEIIATLNEFIDIKDGGVSGSIVAHGAPPLPFEDVILQENYATQAGQSTSSSLFSSITPFFSKIKHKIEGKIPQEILFLGVGILFLFLVWSGISMLSSGVSGDTEKYKNLLNEINTEIGTAGSMIRDSREDEALVYLAKTKAKAEDALQNSTFPTDSQRYLNKIIEMEDEITDTTRISGNAFADISTKNPEDILNGVFLFDKEIYSFSAKNLYRIVGKKIENVIPLKEEEEVIKAIPLEKKQQMVFLTKRGGILEVSKTEASYGKTEDSASWKPNAKNIGFYDKNIYILSPGNNEIYKYKRGQDKYSKPSAYNKNSDLSDAIDLAIDGNIFVLKENGIVLKLLKGVEQDFELKKIPQNFNTVTEIVTSLDSDLLLFLSPTEKTVFVFKKNENSAVYMQQIVIDVENEELSGLALDSEIGRIIVSGKQKLYEIPLITQ